MKCEVEITNFEPGTCGIMNASPGFYEVLDCTSVKYLIVFSKPYVSDSNEIMNTMIIGYDGRFDHPTSPDAWKKILLRPISKNIKISAIKE